MTGSAARIPVNLITGFLGVGKTTAVRHLLAQRPAAETWGVLVNEFGEIGVDGSLLAGQGAPVQEVAGGCLCCVAAPAFTTGLNRLIREHRPDRILIEPSGERAWVANTNADLVTVLDLETWKVAGRIAPGREPDGMAWSPLPPPSIGIVANGCPPRTRKRRRRRIIVIITTGLVLRRRPHEMAGCRLWAV